MSTAIVWKVPGLGSCTVVATMRQDYGRLDVLAFTAFSASMRGGNSLPSLHCRTTGSIPARIIWILLEIY